MSMSMGSRSGAAVGAGDFSAGFSRSFRGVVWPLGRNRWRFVLVERVLFLRSGVGAAGGASLAAGWLTGGS